MQRGHLNQEIVSCRACPRLVEWRERVAIEKRKSFENEEYWGKPVPNFEASGEISGLIVGLAPAAHGANRTGRMFTGDRSGDWLYRALHEAGLCNKPEATTIDDGLQLFRIAITAVAHCAPPVNKPTTDEINNCRRFLVQSIAVYRPKAYLCLGGIAWTNLHQVLGVRAPKLAHGAVSELENGVIAFASYHPSQQNTFTGRLTKQMLDEVVQRFATYCL